MDAVSFVHLPKFFNLHGDTLADDVNEAFGYDSNIVLILLSQSRFLLYVKGEVPAFVQDKPMDRGIFIDERCLEIRGVMPDIFKC